MAIQAQMYPENLGLPISSQDWLFMGYNNNINNSMNNNNNNMFVNGGCGVNEFSFNNLQQKLQQQQQQQLQYQQQQQELLQQQYMVFHLQNVQQKNASFNNNSNSFLFATPSKKQKLAPTTTTTTATTASTTTTESDNRHMPVNLSQSLSAQLEKQGLEIDRYISLQNEKLKLALQEQRKQQFAAIINRLEQKAMQLMRQKDDEIAEAAKKSMDLQEIISKMEVEKQAWQRVATENESMVISLSNTLEQLKEQQQAGCLTTCSSSSSNDDAESCCNIFDNNMNNRGKEAICVAETGENRGVTGSEGKEATGTMCEVCNSRSSCMLLLPCRHLCCCKVCEAFLDACPVCKLAKRASIEALIS